MNTALHKGSSGIARFASLELVIPQAPRAEPEPDPRDLDIARLKTEVEDLKLRLLAAERSDEAEREALISEARRVAAHEYQQDDQRRINTLVAVTEKALAQFEMVLVEQSHQLALRLAASALQRLVELRKADTDWLQRAIQRRLQSLGSEAIVSLQIATPDCSDKIVRELSARLAAGVEVDPNPTLAAGSAKICLRLGEVVVDPVAGAKQLFAFLEEAEAADD